MFNQMKNLMDMQKQAKEMKKTVEAVKVERETSDGRLKISMNGAFKVESLSIDETLLRPDNQEYLQNALKVIDDPTILVNVVSRRVKQLRRGNRSLIESLEKLTAEDTALREIAEGKISYELATVEDLARHRTN